MAYHERPDWRDFVLDFSNETNPTLDPFIFTPDSSQFSTEFPQVKPVETDFIQFKIYDAGREYWKLKGGVSKAIYEAGLQLNKYVLSAIALHRRETSHPLFVTKDPIYRLRMPPPPLFDRAWVEHNPLVLNADLVVVDEFIAIFQSRVQRLQVWISAYKSVIKTLREETETAIEPPVAPSLYRCSKAGMKLAFLPSSFFNATFCPSTVPNFQSFEAKPTVRLPERPSQPIAYNQERPAVVHQHPTITVPLPDLYQKRLLITWVGHDHKVLSNSGDYIKFPKISARCLPRPTCEDLPRPETNKSLFELSDLSDEEQETTAAPHPEEGMGAGTSPFTDGSKILTGVGKI